MLATRTLGHPMQFQLKRVILFCNDIEKVAEFYEQKLGLK
ncbi:MAG: VOC family protein, partial [SAR202 cluster bacterium]|nr:VOC family protein [SAR202 cluster bacterium]